MKLFVCWNTSSGPGPGLHPCGKAYDALREAGHQPEVVKARGSRVLPDALNRTPGRQEVKRLTGDTTVPVLVTDDNEVLRESKAIIDWARAHPAP